MTKLIADFNCNHGIGGAARLDYLSKLLKTTEEYSLPNFIKYLLKVAKNGEDIFRERSTQAAQPPNEKYKVLSEMGLSE